MHSALRLHRYEMLAPNVKLHYWNTQHVAAEKPVLSRLHT